MNKKILLVLAMTMLLVFTIAQVSAFMPKNTHKLIFTKALDTQQTSEVYKACKQFPKLCYSGNVLADVSVIWYWTKGENYDVTHSPNFCRALLEGARSEEEYACAVGGCTHQPADIESHNKMVPFAIENSKLTNYVIHVFAEQKVDNWVEDKYPTIGSEALNAMADYDKCIPLFKRVMKGNNEYSGITDSEFDDIFDKFIWEIKTSQTGYDTAFKNKGFAVNIKALPFSIIAGYSFIMLFFILVTVLLIVKMVKRQAKLKHFIAVVIFGLLMALFIYVFVMNLQGQAFKAVVTIAKPISYLVPLGNTPENYVNVGIENTKTFFAQGELWLSDMGAGGSVASGRVPLETADRSVMFFDYIIAIVLFLALALYVWYLFKSNKVEGPTYGGFG